MLDSNGLRHHAYLLVHTPPELAQNPESVDRRKEFEGCCFFLHIGTRGELSAWHRSPNNGSARFCFCPATGMTNDGSLRTMFFLCKAHSSVQSTAYSLQLGKHTQERIAWAPSLYSRLANRVVWTVGWPVQVRFVQTRSCLSRPGWLAWLTQASPSAPHARPGFLLFVVRANFCGC